MNNTNTRLSGDSLNISEQRKQELKQLFPGVFTETKNDDGKLVESIDFERLKAELGQFSEIYDNRRERYAMDWPGKKDTLRQIQEPSRATLKPCREESVDFDTTENLFIEGDNLEVLKLLQKSYYGAVKMIYIDPPYNTGKEFIYPDNFTESLDTYLEYAGLKEVGGEGRKFSTNSQNEGRFHSKWLNMMYPRLYLARNLLREDGVIFISIDDNEVENLRRICDEIFGEENHIACLVWEKSRKNDAKFFSVGHEYILVYARSLSKLNEKGVIWRESKPGAKEILDEFNKLKGKYGDNFPKIERDLAIFYKSLPKDHPSKKHSRYNRVDVGGIWRDDNMSWPGGNGPRYELIHPETKKPCAIPPGGWRYANIEKMNEMISTGVVVFRDDHTLPPIRKTYLLSDQDDGESLIGSQVMGSYFYRSALQASNTLTDLLGERVFENPKDHEIISRLMSYTMEDGDLVLDFFSGSATTGHSTFELIAKSKLSYNFILVQLPEKTDTSSIASQAGFETISDIAKERLRRAGAKIRTELEGQLDLADQQTLDLGFKVFKLDQSNFKQWQAPSKDTSNDELVRQMELHIDPVDQNASQEDLLYEILLKIGIAPTEQIEVLELAGHPIYSVSDGMILIHLEKHTDQALIDAVLDQQPTQFICLDSAFHGNEQMKANAVKSFATFNQEKVGIDRIDFKTV